MITKKSIEAMKITFTEDKMIVYLDDGRELAIALEWFPKHRSASREQLNNWRFIGGGEGIHWEELDEDISVRALFV